MSRIQYAYRLNVTLPEGSDDPDWEPPNWEEVCVERGWIDPDDRANVLPPFAWPRRRIYFSSSSAETRAKMLREYGATVVVERSNPITWPDA